MKNFKTKIMAVIAVLLLAVSYTHLDVYKRQVWKEDSTTFPADP